MGNAVWLLTVLVPWYFGLLWGGLGEWIALVVWAALALFVVGGALAIRQRNSRSFAILSTVLVSFITVAVAGFLRGQIQGAGAIRMILWSITALQAAIAIGVFTWARGGRFATAMMAPQCATFWMFTEFVSSMSFADSWL